MNLMRLRFLVGHAIHLVKLDQKHENVQRDRSLSVSLCLCVFSIYIYKMMNTTNIHTHTSHDERSFNSDNDFKANWLVAYQPHDCESINSMLYLHFAFLFGFIVCLRCAIPCKESCEITVDEWRAQSWLDIHWVGV